MNTIILISCSRGKTDAGGTIFKEQIFFQILSSVLQNELLEKRKVLRKYLKNYQITDFKFKEGNRGDRQENMALIDGSDFGGNDQGLVYLPAYQRYKGRFFGQLDKKDWDKCKQFGYHVLILSGLYGLLSPNDSIQNYDCHLTDRIIDQSNQNELSTIKNLWGNFLTEALKEFIKNNKITRIIDLLSEEDYQSAIDWMSISGVKVLHRIFAKQSGRDAIPNMCKFLKYEILLKKPEELEIKENEFIERNYLNGDSIAFETIIGEMPLGAREGKRKYDAVLIKKFSKENWEIFNNTEKNDLRNYEELFVKKFTQVEIGIIVPIIAGYWVLLEKRRKKLMLKVCLGKNKPIKLKINGEEKDIKISEIINDTFYTISLLREFSQFLASPFRNKIEIPREFFDNYFNKYNELRKLRNDYLHVNYNNNNIHEEGSEKQIAKAREDMDKFRSIFFHKKYSPFLLFVELEKYIKELSNFIVR